MIQAPRKSDRWIVLGYEQRFIADTLRVVDSLETLATSEAFLSGDTALLGALRVHTAVDGTDGKAVQDVD